MWKHNKRGTTYDIVAHGTFQINDTKYDNLDVVVYRCRETGHVWVRTNKEFYDGRFVELAYGE